MELELASLRLNRLRLQDIPWIMEHMRIHYPPAYTYLWSDNGAWYLKEMYNAKRLAEEFTDPRAKFYRIEDGQQHYGYCKTISGKPPARYGQYANYCYLQRLYLNTNIQGKGIGGWVMNQLLDQAIANGHDAMWLETMEIGKARKFYERLGFSVIDKVRLPFPGMIEELRGLEVMEKSLLA